MKRVLILATICLGMGMTNITADAAFVEWNGHYYQAVLQTAAWDDAQAGADARGGYLASITSAEENDFVYSLVDESAYWVNEYGGPWIGGYQPEGSPEPSGNWTWVSGEPWTYENWWPDHQPDDAGGHEDFLQLHGGPLHGGPYWNDVSRELLLHGYIMERDSPPTYEVEGEYGGCRYTAVHERVNWDGAMAGASARGGYLATITSAEESEFVAGLVDDPVFWLVDGISGPWIGGYQPEDTPEAAEPAGNWTWVSGESWDSYANARWWPDQQPSDSNGIEDFLHLHKGSPYVGLYWNDLSRDVLLEGYIVQYHEASCHVVATESATWGAVKSMYR